MTEITLKRADQLSFDEREAWTTLQEQDPRLASPYFSLGFFDAVSWARPDTRVVIKTRAGEPVAFLPLHKGLTGHARPLAGPLGDHHGVIGEAMNQGTLARLLKSAGVGVMDFHGAWAWQTGFNTAAQSRDGSWVMDLSDGYDAYVSARSAAEPKAFRNLRARQRKIDQAGAVLRVHDTRPGILQIAMRWKSQQYQASGHFDVFSVDWTRTLMRELNRIDRPDCAGLVSSLEIDGELAAVHFGMRSKDVLHYWFPVYDPKFSKLGPGLALLMGISEAMAGEGVREVHLGPGAYDFKAHLASWQIPLASGYVGKGFAARVRGLADQVERQAERLPLGRMGHWPGKAFRRIDQFAGFRPA